MTKYLRPAISLGLFLVLFFPLFPELVSQWSTDPDSSHGFLIPLLSAYFIWTRREELKRIPIEEWSAGIWMVLAGSVLFVFSKMGFQFYFQCVGMLVVLYGLAAIHLGKGMVKKLTFPGLYLVFMIPLPQIVYETLTMHLRLFSTNLAYLVIRLVGIPATREGNIIKLQTASLIVGNPCSGLRGLVSFIVGSLAIGYLFQKKVANRVILVGVSIILAMVLNILRLVFLAVIAHTLRLEKIPISIHDAEGMIVLIIGLFIMFGINDFLTKKNG